MFRVKEYDLGTEIERVGFYSDVVENMKKKKEDNYAFIGERKNEYKKNYYTEEQKKEINKEKSISRSKTKIRRLAQRYNMRYMWTLTFAKKKVVTFNPVNKKTVVYDAGNYEDAWRIWKSFLKRCSDHGLTFNYIVTIEVQEERLKTYGEKVYHFHFITDKPIPVNKERAKRAGKKYYMWMLWTHGASFVTKKKSKKKLVHLYIVKYLSKLIDEMGSGRQRYRVNNGLTVPVSEFTLNSHIEFFEIVEAKSIKKNNYSVIGELEIFWMIFEKEMQFL